MSFVSSPPAGSSPATVADELVHDGFFPGVKLSEMRETFRFFGQVADARLKLALVGGMLTVSSELSTWCADKVAAGLANLDAVGDLEGWKERLGLLYARAVGSFAAAELAETHHDVSATGDGEKRAADRALSSDDYRRQGTHAVRDMLGVGRTAVELI